MTDNESLALINTVKDFTKVVEKHGEELKTILEICKSINRRIDIVEQRIDLLKDRIAFAGEDEDLHDSILNDISHTYGSDE